MSATETLSRFIVDATLAGMPGEALNQARRAFLDTLGVTVAGSTEDGPRILLEFAAERGGSPTATILGTGLRSDCLTAALVNGTMAHALDYDDVNDAMIGHPSAPLVSAIMALGEEIGSSGADALEAFIIGFEVECKLGLAVGRSHYVKGWHATCTLGTIGAAAAASKLLKLDEQRTRMALGIAASSSGGLRRNFGTMTKPLHVGQAAKNGIQAALLAEKGFTASQEIMDEPLDFCRIFSIDDWDVSRMEGALGSPWEILTSGITVKKYPCCNNNHRTLDATLGLIAEYRPDPEEIAGVSVTMPRGEDLALIYSRATTGLEGKFCMQFCVASALLDGVVNTATFEAEQVARARVQALSELVQLVEDPDQAPVLPESPGHVEVMVTMASGDRHANATSVARGTPENPLSWEDLEEKYASCCSGILGAEEIRRSVDQINRLDELMDVRGLMSALSLSVPAGRVS
jgi:2-methylcitrate dehydratase PrpD